jgi:hypothetical protein
MPFNRGVSKMASNKCFSEQWLIASYRPTSLFTLRMTHATSKGGKTLLVPTPYAVKLALIDACFRFFPAAEALEQAHNVYDLIKAREIRFRPPEHCLVQNTFIKVKQEERGGPGGTYTSTIAYREYCYYRGELAVAVDVAAMSGASRQLLTRLAPCINYLGKRGSFMQFVSTQTYEGPLPSGYTCPENKADIANGGYASTNYLDDFGEALIGDADGFDRINSYGGKPSALGKYRVLTRTLLPYRYVSGGKHYSYYTRLSANSPRS